MSFSDALLLAGWLIPVLFVGCAAIYSTVWLERGRTADEPRIVTMRPVHAAPDRLAAADRNARPANHVRKLAHETAYFAN